MQQNIIAHNKYAYQTNCLNKLIGNTKVQKITDTEICEFGCLYSNRSTDDVKIWWEQKYAQVTVLLVLCIYQSTDPLKTVLFFYIIFIEKHARELK